MRTISLRSAQEKGILDNSKTGSWWGVLELGSGAIERR